MYYNSLYISTRGVIFMKRFRFTLGFVAGAVMFGSIGVAAASSSKTIEVMFGVKDVKINSVSKMPEETPFLYEGTTYVPLRYIAENLGSEVRWDGENQIIIINSKQNACTNETFDISKYVGKWEIELTIDSDNKGWDERITNSFEMEIINGNKLKISHGDLYNSQVYYDENGFPTDQSSSPYNWESNPFEVNSDGTADIIIAVENYPDKEIQAHIELNNNQIVIKTKENESFFYFNQSPPFAKTE